MKPHTAAASDAHVMLKQLYDERVPKEMTQEEFGKQFGIGSQGMVWQYLSGRRPLNVEAAAKFARGLRCTIFDISPAMAEALKENVVPVLGPKSWWIRRVAKATMLLLAISPTFAPSPADAGEISAATGRLCIMLNRVRRFFGQLGSKQRSIAIS